jgi:hypothetical protein
LDYFYQQSVNLVWQGMAAGIASEEIFEQLKAAVGDVYGHGEVRLIFFECNEHDTSEMGRGLNETLGIKVEYRVLDYFYSNLAIPNTIHHHHVPSPGGDYRSDQSA